MKLGKLEISCRSFEKTIRPAISKLPDLLNLRTGKSLSNGWRKGNTNYWVQYRADHGIFYCSEWLAAQYPTGVKKHKGGGYAVHSLATVTQMLEHLCVSFA